jgi:uncharacterized membrane protein (DUF373 family)
MISRLFIIGALSLFSALLSVAFAASQYGPTQQGDSLWVIADQVQDGSRLSRAELVDWLYRENPHAFRNNDSDQLRIGVMLRLPASRQEDEPDAALPPRVPNGLGTATSRSAAPSGIATQDRLSGAESQIQFDPNAIADTQPERRPQNDSVVAPDGPGLTPIVEAPEAPTQVSSTAETPDAESQPVMPQATSIEQQSTPATASRSGVEEPSQQDAVSDTGVLSGRTEEAEGWRNDWPNSLFLSVVALGFVVVVALILVSARLLQAWRPTRPPDHTVARSVSEPDGTDRKAPIDPPNAHGSGHEELPTSHHDSVLAFMHRILRVAAYVLAITMLIVILEGVVSVVRTVVLNMSQPPYLIIPDIVKTFSAFLAVLIAYEIFANITLYIRSDVFPVKLVIATALMAVARKVIVLDLNELTAWDVLGLGGLVLGLGVAYWLVSQADLCKPKQ